MPICSLFCTNMDIITLGADIDLQALDEESRRELEFHADDFAFDLLSDVDTPHFNLAAICTFFTLAAAVTSWSGQAPIESTHPSLESRLRKGLSRLSTLDGQYADLHVGLLVWARAAGEWVRERNIMSKIDEFREINEGQG